MTDSANEIATQAVAPRDGHFDFGVRLTEAAHAKALERLTESGELAQGLRLGVRGGGCAGYAYVIDVAKRVRPERDTIFDLQGLRVVVDSKSLEVLRGATLDWETHLMSYGFRWRHPRALDACGCGVSFDLKDEAGDSA